MHAEVLIVRFVREELDDHRQSTRDEALSCRALCQETMTNDRKRFIGEPVIWSIDRIAIVDGKDVARRREKNWTERESLRILSPRFYRVDTK